MSRCVFGNGRVTKEMAPGIESSMEALLAFIDWADKAGPRLTPAKIRSHYGCSQATSYRWFKAYRRVRQKAAA